MCANGDQSQPAHEEVIEAAKVIALWNRIGWPYVSGLTCDTADILAVHVATDDHDLILRRIVENASQLGNAAHPSEICRCAETSGVHANSLILDFDRGASSNALGLSVSRFAGKDKLRVAVSRPA